MDYQNKIEMTEMAHAPSLRGRLLQCAAASAAAWALVHSPAHAAIPPECDVQNNPNIVTCVVPEPDELGPIDLDQDNTTIVIGSADTPTVLNTNSADGILLNGDGAQSVVINENSIVNSESDNGIVMSGSGTLSVVTQTLSGVSAAGGDGILIDAAGDVNLSLEGSVAGGQTGVNVSNTGGGDITITASGSEITGFQANGIDVINIASGDLSIDTSGAEVIGRLDGIEAGSSGVGTVSIITGDVEGTDSIGISLETTGGVTDALIDSTAGSVFGGSSGVWFINDAAMADMRIVTADVSGGTGAGILAQNEGQSLSIDSSAGTVTSGSVGISANQMGDGPLTVVTADVVSENSDGIVAVTSGNGLTIDSRAGSVSALSSAIVADHNGMGNLTVNAANVSSSEGAGIVANSEVGTNVSISTVDGVVSAGTTGILVANSGAGLTNIVTGDVIANEADGLFVQSTANGTNTAIDTSSGTVRAGRNGIFVEHLGGGALSLTTGAVTGLTEVGISALNAGTKLTIDTSAGAVQGATSGLLIQHGGSGDGLVTTGDVIGESEFGILAVSGGVDFILDSTAGSISGVLGGITANNLGTGRIDLLTGSVAASDGSAILALNGGTNMFVDTSAGSVSGALDGIDLTNAGSGTLVVLTADVAGAGARGISANNVGTDFSVDTRLGSVSGATDGIVAEHDGSGNLTVNTASVSGGSGAGIIANSSFGTNISISTVDGAVSGGTNGIEVDHTGAGLTTIVTADVNAAQGDGIFSRTAGSTTTQTIDTSAGTVRAGDTGIDVEHLGSGDLDIMTGAVTGLGSAGIFAINEGENLNIDTSAGVVQGSTIGLLAEQSGPGDATITTGDVIGETEFGLFAVTFGNDFLIDTSAGAVSGVMGGVVADQQGAGQLDLVTGDVTATDGAAVLAGNDAGTSLLVDTAAGSVSGTTWGVRTVHSGTGLLSVATSDVEATAADGIGIEVENTGNGALIDSTAGSVTGGSEGILVTNISGELTIRTGNVTGQAGNGILAGNGVGGTFLTIDSSTGAVSGAVSGIVAVNQGNRALRITTGDVTGTAELGVSATNEATGTDLVIDTSAGSVAAGLAGITATNNGTGSLSVTTGNVTSDASDGVRAANAGTGLLSIDTSAGAINAGDTGIVATQNSSEALAIVSGDITAASDGIRLETQGGGATIDNSGAITAGNFAVFATDASLGAITLNNAGTINGAVRLGVVNDTVANTGLFNATADSLFGAGEDVFFNNGRLQATGALGFTGLELLNNGGTISLANGNPGDTLQLSGDYLGTGGRLELDVESAAMNGADRLIVDGAATGNSVVDISGQLPLDAFGTPIVVVDAGAGTVADAFTLDSADQGNFGFLSLALNFDAVNNDFVLDSAIGAPVFQALKFTEGAQSLWYRSADAWASHIDSKRHAGSEQKTPLWLQFYGVGTDRDESFAFASGSVDQDISLDYSQDFFGLQGGFEFGEGASGQGFVYGLTLGYLSSDLGFDGVTDSVRYDAFNAGAYVGYLSDGFFANALIKYDGVDANVDNNTVGYETDLSGDAYGARFEAGYRLGSDSFFAEPVASLEYQSTSLDDFAVGNAAFDLESYDGLRGKAGARIGGQTKVNGTSTLTYYSGAKVVHEFEGEGGLTFSLPNASIAIANHAIGTYGQVDLGLNIATESNVTGFIEGNADFGGEFSSFGGRAGIRIAF